MLEILRGTKCKVNLGKGGDSRRKDKDIDYKVRYGL